MVMAVGSPRATSCAKDGPLRAAIRKSKSPACRTERDEGGAPSPFITWPITSVMRRSDSSSRPFVALTIRAFGGTSGRMRSKRRRQCCEGMTLTTMSESLSVAARSLLAETDSGIARPGRNLSFTCWRVIDSQTSSSCAQRRTRWLPLRPRTMARPVPQAPPPMTVIWLIYFPSFFLSHRETRLSAREETADVLVMADDDERGGGADQR